MEERFSREKKKWYRYQYISKRIILKEIDVKNRCYAGEKRNSEKKGKASLLVKGGEFPPSPREKQVLRSQKKRKKGGRGGEPSVGSRQNSSAERKTSTILRKRFKQIRIETGGGGWSRKRKLRLLLQREAEEGRGGSPRWGERGSRKVSLSHKALSLKERQSRTKGCRAKRREGFLLLRKIVLS